MPELEIKDEVKQMGSSRYIPLPAWLCTQLKIDGGTEYTLTMERDSDDTMMLVFAVAGQETSKTGRRRN